MILCRKCMGNGAYIGIGCILTDCLECEGTGQKKIPITIKEDKRKKKKEVEDGREKT